MLLEYFIWGSWYVTMGTYMSEFLKSSGVQIGAAYSALAIATMISPFFIGMVADRFFAAQRIMGVLHLLGGVLLYSATLITDNTAFYWVIVFYSLVVHAHHCAIKQYCLSSNDRSGKTISMDQSFWNDRLDRCWSDDRCLVD